jgi:hypothetical protein
MKIIKLFTQPIKGFILWIWYYINKSYRNKRKAEAERRIKICESCEYFWKPARNCMICGCFMDIKTKMYFDLDENGISVDGCFEGRW